MNYVALVWILSRLHNYVLYELWAPDGREVRHLGSYQRNVELILDVLWTKRILLQPKCSIML